MIRKTVCLLFVGLSCLVGATPVGAAEGVGTRFVGDLNSIDRAVLDAADLSAPAIGATTRQPQRGYARPMAHSGAALAAADRPQVAPKSVGLFGRIKSAFSSGGKSKAQPAEDPFATAQRQARNQVVEQRAPTRDPRLQPIPSFVSDDTDRVATVAHQRPAGSAQPGRNTGGLALRQGSATRQGLLSSLWNNDSPSTPQPVARQAAQRVAPQAGVRKQSKPTTFASSALDRQAPPMLKPAPRPKRLASSGTSGRPTTGTAFVKSKPTPSQPTRRLATMALASDEGEPSNGVSVQQAAKLRPIQLSPAKSPAKTTQAAPRLLANTPAPKSQATPTTQPSRPAPQAKPVVRLAATPQRGSRDLASDLPATIEANPYARTSDAARGPSRRRVTVAADATEPSDRSRALLAEAHGLAADAGSYEDFSKVIKRCRYVLAIDKSTQAKAYANQLAGWALTKRGDTLDADGRYEESRIDYQEALRADAECWRAEHALGVLAAREGDTDTALTHFNRTIELNPEHAKAYSNRAALSVQAGAYEAALRDYGEAIAVDPDLAVAHTGRGRVCHMLGRMDEGLQHLDAAAILEPNDAMIATGRGDLLTDLGHYGQALAAYERAIVLDPASPAAYRNLAWMQATCPIGAFRNPESAMRNVERAAQLAGAADDLTLDTKAAALAALGRFEEAKQLQQEAIELAPESDSDVYQERLALYERGEAFTSRPVGVRQATYLK